MKVHKSLKEIFEEVGDQKAYTGRSINPDVSLSASDIRASLRAAEDSENNYYNTVTYGIETETGDIVKIYIDAEDENSLDDFEKDLAAILGEEDNIEEILNILDDKYNIVDVDWPESESEESEEADVEDEEEEDLDPIPSDEEIIKKIKDDLKGESSDEESDEEVDNEVEEESDEEESDEESEDEEDAKTEESLDPALTEEEEDDISKLFDPEMKEVLKKYGRGNRYTEFGLVLLREIGVPAEMINYMLRRQPAIRIDIMNSMRELGLSKRQRIANVLEFDPKVADDIKNQTEELEAEAEMIKEDEELVITDNVNFQLQLNKNEFLSVKNAMCNNQKYTIENIDDKGSEISFIPNHENKTFEVNLPNGDTHKFTLEYLKEL